MKIAIIGTHASGKSILCHELTAALQKKGKKVRLIPEMSRLCPMPVNENTAFEAQYWILASQIGHELEACHAADVVVCDRGVVDNYIYLKRKFPERAEALLSLVLEHCKSYDLIVKTVPDQPLKDDGFRSTNKAFRQEIEASLNQFLEEHNIAHIVVKGDQRAATVLSAVNHD